MDKINFQDIQAQYLNRYQLVKVDGTEDQYDLIPVRGAVTQEGTQIRALELNQLQDNVDTALAEKLPAMPMDYTVSAGGANNNYAEVHAYTTYTNMLRTVNGTNISARNSLIPYASESCNLGTSAIKWNNVYANNVYQNGYKAWDSSSLPYETGTWEPKLKGSGSEYSGSNYITTPGSSGTGATFGFYTRIGDIVHGSFMWYYSGAFTSISKADPLYIKLPFAAGCFTNFPISYYTGITKSTINPMFGTMAYNSAYATLRFGNAESFTALQGSHIYGNANVRFSSTFSYKIKE